MLPELLPALGFRGRTRRSWRTIGMRRVHAAATNALNAAKGAQGNGIKNHSVNVGTGGMTLSGNSPDNSKGVLILMFTEGRAFVTLEFDGPVDQAPPQDFVTDVGQKQDAAVKKGLGG